VVHSTISFFNILNSFYILFLFIYFTINKCDTRVGCFVSTWGHHMDSVEDHTVRERLHKQHIGIIVHSESASLSPKQKYYRFFVFSIFFISIATQTHNKHRWLFPIFQFPRWFYHLRHNRAPNAESIGATVPPLRSATYSLLIDFSELRSFSSAHSVLFRIYITSKSISWLRENLLWIFKSES